jgi:hypothetical protein
VCDASGNCECAALSITNLQKENKHSAKKVEQLCGSFGAIETALQHNQESLLKAKDDLQAEIGEIREDLELFRESFSKRVQWTDESVLRTIHRSWRRAASRYR